ncbi:unnamed protein product [Rhizoctonia solani]|uniref:Uncharacterized protein n=1 Tax=Rhizoctonia solani TaxID=456999 RepID=A0A8H3C945_9AGAM|nr:unnamed protein product [Rhizoctonia solani]
MSQLSCVGPPSAPPPGSSIFISNALIIAKRVALGFAQPVQIQAGQWETAHPVVDWYRRHQDANIQCMQLRKEQKSPFYHEYVTFRLDDGSCFRLDRRQLPNEQSPMDCTEASGVEASDTIEQIASLEDSMYNRSDCLVELDFIEGGSLAVFLTVLSAISGHGQAGRYTVQRYNCYFYAQTALLCTLCFQYNRYKGDLWRIGGCNTDSARSPQRELPSPVIEQDSGPIIKILSRQTTTKSHLIQGDRMNNFNRGSGLPTEGSLSIWGVAPVFIQDKRKDVMRESTIGDLKALLWSMIHAHSVRVEQYRFLLRCNAKDVERDIKTAMNEVWRQATFSNYPLDAGLATQQVTPPKDQVRIQFSWSLDSNTPFSHWRQRYQSSSIASMQLRKEGTAPFHEYVAFSLDNRRFFRVDRRPLPCEQLPIARTEAKGVEAYDTIEQIGALTDSTYNSSVCLIQLDFGTGVNLGCLLRVFKSIARHKRATVYTIQRFNSYFYAHTIILCTLCLKYGYRNDYIWQAGHSRVHNAVEANSFSPEGVRIRITRQPPVQYLALISRYASDYLNSAVKTSSPTEQFWPH